MSPSIGQLQMSVVTTLATRILPELNPDSYATGDARMASLLTLLLAQETDRAADTLARENREMRALFGRAAALPLSPEFQDRLSELSGGVDTDLRISALSIVHGNLSKVLIELHEAAENASGDWGGPVEREIWALLLKGAENRLLVMPAM